MKYLITGGTGFVGQHLVRRLIEENHDVTLLVRSPEKAQKIFDKTPTLIEWPDVYQKFTIEEKEFDVVVNLMGANIAEKKWSNERKKVLYNSRVDGTRNLLNQLKNQNIKVKKLIQASAIGIYDPKTKEIDESSATINDFLGKLCQDWEKQALENHENVVILRNGMVLGSDGGAMTKILPVFKFGLGGKLASGNQFMSWIHIYDLVSLILKASNEEHMKGVYNAVSQYPVTNEEFTNVLSELLRKPAFFNVPKFALKTILGDMSSVILDDLKVKSSRIKETKFVYRFPTIENALKAVVSK